jgi:hypothetical protein
VPSYACSLLMEISSAQNGKVTDPYYQTSDVQPLMATYEADKGSLNRSFTNSNGFGGGGGGGFGGGGNNNSTGSPERRERLKKLANDYLKQLDELPFEKMKTSSQVDYILFKRAVNNDLRTLARKKQNTNPFTNMFLSPIRFMNWKKGAGAVLRRMFLMLFPNSAQYRNNSMLHPLHLKMRTDSSICHSPSAPKQQ